MTPARLVIRPQRKPLEGSVPVPSDRSITHRASILAALSNGPCELRGFAYGNDNLGTLRALGALGVRYEDDQKGTVRLRGVGLSGLKAPAAPLDCGHSPTTARLLTGVLSAQPFASRLVGSESLSRRRMKAVIEPLKMRGARIACAPCLLDAEDCSLPLDIGGLEAGQRLAPIEYAMTAPNDHAKGALLFSGLFASGPTVIFEPMVSRDHTERLMSELGMPIQAAGSMVSLHPPADPFAIRGFDVDLPGDISAAAFVLVAAEIVPGSNVSTRRTGLNPTRAGILEVIRAFGGRMGITPKGDSLGESWGDVNAIGSVLRGTRVAGELALRALDEIPVTCALAARARGVSEVSDATELREDQPDRVAALAALLRAFGVQTEERPDGLAIEGQPDKPLRAASVSSGGDHRLAMTAAVLGLVADGETIVDDVDCLAVSFPRFAGTLRALGADIEVMR
ncbi:MAG TPA: 3-phosphoshikimate 1-carboxyvinyltransferase [Polyangiaceae bacterium]|jgi:3-phosphoshikimate 1-carboxyvinyltransferase|nr:3-phosphoshikimate 1-carboxyvinyltransferase [Polyangiaceae bacterium]